MNNFQSGDWQNLVYLIIVLVALLSGLLMRRNIPFSKLIKALIAWSLVALVFVALYSYRFEFSALKDRILGEINPSSARVSESGKLVINISQDGHFYLDVTINRTPVRFMIDTGASDIMLNKNDAARIGIKLKELNFTKAYQTANGTSFGASVTLDELELSGIKFHEIGASVNDANMGTSLLGMSFLRKFKRYEFYQDQLLLEM